MAQRVSYWRFFRVVLTLWFVVESIYCAIPDYPWGFSLYEAVTGVNDAPTMWLHEQAIILLIWLFALDISYHVERKEKIERVYIVRRKL